MDSASYFSLHKDDADTYLNMKKEDPSQTTLTVWEVFCFAMLDFCKRGRLENT